MITVLKFCSRSGVLCQGLSFRKASRFLNVTYRPYTSRARNIKDKLDLYVKPLAFTTMVCTGSFCLSYVCYWRGREWVRHSDTLIKAWRWWDHVAGKEKIFCGILLVNTMVFCMWRFPPMQRSMAWYFQSVPDGRPVISMLLSCFSHYEFWHISINMFVLWSFMPAFEKIVGSDNAVPFFISAGVFSSLMSHYNALLRKDFIPSRGASGAIMGVITAVIAHSPDASVYLIFLPFVPIPAVWALGGVITLDLVGLIRGWKVFDHAAHLGGVLFALLYDQVFSAEVVKLKRMIKKLLPPSR
ncbi:presenilin-associated rhomboid-like protein, mitochondrial [Dysidea avara]|uniref:presenilin-associated rhomboid-like protein, mitochondrial n=1 Tax=Dysidea avara TaxID=196820 RepID=UPI003317DFF9